MVALAAASCCGTVHCARGGWRLYSRAAHHRLYFDGRVGRYAQFSAPASLAVAPPAVRLYAAQLGCGWLRQPSCQIQCHADDDAVCRSPVAHTHAHMGTLDCLRMYGRRMLLVVAAPRASSYISAAGQLPTAVEQAHACLACRSRSLGAADPVAQALWHSVLRKIFRFGQKHPNFCVYNLGLVP